VDTLTLGFSLPELERRNLCCFKTQFMAICYLASSQEMGSWHLKHLRLRTW
jgi:hypothetical protein